MTIFVGSKIHKPINMHNQQYMTKMFSLILLLSIGFTCIQAQNLPYERVIRNGQTFYVYEVPQGEGLQAISRRFSVPVADILQHNPGVNAGLQLGQRLYIPVPNIVVNDPNVTYHVILPQETLFSVARAFNLRPDDLVAANEGLSPETFQIGRIIRIPLAAQVNTTLPGHVRHVVQQGETLFGLSRQYQVEQDAIVRSNPAVSEGLRVGMELQIPQGTMFASTQNILPPNPNSPANTIRVALLLSFNEETPQLAHYRLQEYYEGFLLAVAHLKDQGANMEIFPFEIGRDGDTRRLESLLGTLEMQSLDLIIGGTTDTQIRILSDFARLYNIKHVVPFRQNVSEVQTNPHVFQVSVSPQILNARASNEFLRLHRASNIIFVSGGQNNQQAFVHQLQADLRRIGIPFETLTTTEMHTELRSRLNSNQPNVIVPTSDDIELLRLILNELDEIYDSNPLLTMNLFGYRVWQTYIGLTRRFHRFGTHIFTDFFVAENDTRTRTFNDNFRRWYGRTPRFNYPNFAMRGYDTGLFFLTALHRHGTNFEPHLRQLHVPTLQYVFHFERTNNWGGFINTGIILVHYDTNGIVHRIDRSFP